MKYLKVFALCMAVFTAMVMVAGFTTRNAFSQGQPHNEGEIKEDHIPSKVTCIANGHVIGYSTICREKAGYWCIETFCPEETAEKDKKPILAYCVAYQSVLAYANGCVTSAGSECAVTACPAGTSAVVRD